MKNTRPMRLPSLTPVVAALLAAGFAAPPAFAQQAAAPAADEDPGQRVVITSNKRAERQREVAGNTGVIDGSDLERRGARDQESYLKLTPGVQFNKGDIASNTITIRGIGTSTTNEGAGLQQNPTGQYLEDVPLASPAGKGTVLDPLAWDLDRVEVLRGPQGVLFGSGSLGGAVRYLFNKPRLKEFEASLKGELASVAQGGREFSLYGMLNAPLGDGAAVRVVAFDRKDPGYVDNLGSGKKDANTLDQRGGRVLVTVQPTSALTATLVASTQKSEQGDTFSISPDANRLEHTAPNNSRRTSQTDFYSLTVDWNLGRHTLTSITGHWRNRNTSLIDDTELFASVGFPLPGVNRPASGSQKASSQELRIATNPGASIAWVAGAFYQSSKAAGVAKQIDPTATFGFTDLVDLKSDGSGSEAAIFGDAEFTLGSGWSLAAGGRYYRTTSDANQTGTTFGAPADSNPPEGKDSGVTPRVSVKYRFGENLWYALASKGYRYGGTNGTPPFEPYESDSMWNYETGVKLAPMPGLQLDLTVFVQDWKKAQFTYFRVRNNLPESVIGNVGEARSTGLEAALRWRPTAAFDLGLSLAYIDAKTKVDTPIPAGGANQVLAPSGSRLPGTARLQGALQGNLRFAGPFGSAGRANATYTHVGDRVMFLGGNKPADAYDTLDLGASFALGHWTLAAGVANVTDERGVQSITGAPAGVGTFAQYFVQRPRTTTLSLRYDF